MVQKRGLEPLQTTMPTRSLVLRVCQFRHFCTYTKSEFIAIIILYSFPSILRNKLMYNRFNGFLYISDKPLKWLKSCCLIYITQLKLWASIITLYILMGKGKSLGKADITYFLWDYFLVFLFSFQSQ